MILRRTYREIRVDQLVLFLAQGGQHEPATEPGHAPLQPKLDVLADLAANDRVDLRNLQAHDLVRRYPARLDPVADLGQQRLHRLVQLSKLRPGDLAILREPHPLSRRLVQCQFESVLHLLDDVRHRRRQLHPRSLRLVLREQSKLPQLLLRRLNQAPRPLHESSPRWSHPRGHEVGSQPARLQTNRPRIQPMPP